MTDSLATKDDLREIHGLLEYLERHFDTRLAELERRMESRFGEQAARFGGQLADLERRMTVRLGGITVAGIGVVSALVRIL